MAQQTEQEEGHISSSFKKHQTSPQETLVPTLQPGWGRWHWSPRAHVSFPSLGERGGTGSDNSHVIETEQAL